MNSNDGARFALAICGGIIFGALIDNMFIGLVLGFAIGLGLLKWKGRKL